jgi:hypothetical protein
VQPIIPTVRPSYSGATVSSRPRRAQRGSVLVYILVLTIAMATVVLTIVSLSGFHYNQVVHGEHAVRAQYAFEGAVNTTRYTMENTPQTFPNTTNLTIGSFTVATTTSDNNGTLAKTVQIALSTSRWNRTFTDTVVIGNCAPISSPTLWNYAVTMNSTTALPHHLSTSDSLDGTGAKVYANQNFSATANGTLNGNLYLTGPGPADSNAVMGAGYTKNYNQGVLPWPQLSNVRYKKAATTVYNTGQTISNPTAASGTPLIYVNGDLHIKGNLNGTLTYYATGNIYLDDNINDTSGTDALVLITPNTIYSATASKSYAAYMFCDTFMIRDVVTVSRGSIACRAFDWSNSKDVNVTYDPTIKQSPSLGTSLHMPGLWP